MNYKEIKIVVVDIDGTIADNSVVSDVTFETINKLQNHGFIFGVASGRPLYQTESFLKNWKTVRRPDFLIGMNGSELYIERTKQIYNYNVLSVDDLKNIIDYINPIHHLGNLFVYSDEQMIYEKSDNDCLLHQSMKKYGTGKVRCADSIEELYRKSNAKILFRLFDASDMGKVELYLNEHPTTYFVGAKTCETLMEFMHPETDKKNALIEYCALEGYSLNEVIAFGDSTNDNGLLEISGIGVCLKNGSSDTKKIADIITDDDCKDDGFAKFVIKHLLQDKQ